ncbi:MAG: hypothetical protein JO166_24635 [Deltaproteobacteria bacterium]|nr:hypothetical protein [Deltaproteobacteria bacterium]
MKRISWILILVAASASVALGQAGDVLFQKSGGIVTARAVGGAPLAPITGAPYSATMTTEMVQTLSDGTHITQTTTGNVARDSEGRTRQDAPLLSFGNLSAADARHLVFIQDPVAQVSYTLDLTDKTAQKMPVMPPPPGADVGAAVAGNGKFLVPKGVAVPYAGLVPMMPLPPAPGGQKVMIQRTAVGDGEFANAKTEDLGSQTMEGVTVTGTRTTRTIPKGKIGNDAPISIVTEVWTSPELKTVLYSKRTDPRMGEQTFQLTNISRSEPDPSLFTVPSGFTVTDGPQPIQYRDR